MANDLVRGKVYNHGQTCPTVDYVWVPERQRDELIAKFTGAVQAAYYQDGIFKAVCACHNG